MKKFLLSLTTIMMVTLASVCVVSCGDDDDDGGAGSTSSGLKVNAKYGYYYKGSSEHWEFYFCSHDMNSRDVLNATIDMVIIELKAQSEDGKIPEGEFSGNFAVDVEKGMKVNSNGESTDGMYYESGSRSNTTGKLTIKKSGSNYTVSYSGVDFYSDDSNTPSVSNASFSFTGPLTKYHWDNE